MAKGFFFSACRDNEVILLVNDDDPAMKVRIPSVAERVTTIVEMCIKNMLWLKNGELPSDEQYDALIVSGGNAGIIAFKGGIMNIG